MATETAIAVSNCCQLLVELHRDLLSWGWAVDWLVVLVGAAV